MPNSAKQEDSSPNQTSSQTQDISSQGTQSQVEPSDNNYWQTVHFPGAIAVDQIPGVISHSRPNAMDSFSTNQDSSPNPDNQTQHEAELLSLIRDLNDCNDVLLAKVSQLEDSLERSQTALQSEIDRSSAPVEPLATSANSDREIAHLITELEQSNQSLQQHQMRNQTLQTELLTTQEHAAQLELEHTNLLHQHNEQSQALLTADTSCRDLRARLQRQQRYTMQFKAALEKCLSMAPASASSTTSRGSSEVGDGGTVAAMPKTDRIRPWDAGMVSGKADPQLTSMIRGLNGFNTGTSPTVPPSVTETEAETQLWHDLARVMDPPTAIPETVTPATITEATTSEIAAPKLAISPDAASPDRSSLDGLSQFTEPSPWGEPPAKTSTPIPAISDVMLTHGDPLNQEEAPAAPTIEASPSHSEILARVQAARMKATETYLPAMSAQESSPSPLVSPLRPQKRIESLSAIDLPSFPRLKKQSQS